MTGAGFRDVGLTDVTESFLMIARAWQSEFLRHERELREIMGDEWEERLSDRADLIRGAEQGLLRRVFATGTAPN
jgi:precorrin-6x reductase